MPKPLYVAVCESRFYHTLPPHINVVNLSGPASARSRVLMPTNALLGRFKSLNFESPSDEPANCARAYVDLLRLRYRASEADQQAFLSMIAKPILIVVIGRSAESINWEYVAITDVLLAMATKQGRQAEFLGRVLPTRLPRQVA